jgi:hypothetical protein
MSLLVISGAVDAATASISGSGMPTETFMLYCSGIVTVMELIAIVPPATIVLLSNVMSGVSAASPDVPCKMHTLSLSYILKCPASPLASALVSLDIAFAVATPELAAPNAGSLIVFVPSNVPESAVAGVAGGAPVRCPIVPAPTPPSTRSTIASAIAVRADTPILMLEAITFHLVREL